MSLFRRITKIIQRSGCRLLCAGALRVLAACDESALPDDEPPNEIIRPRHKRTFESEYMRNLEKWSDVAKRAGFRSLRAWAQAAGYSPQTVYCAVRVWGMRDNDQPHGGMNRQIMAKLRDLDRPHAA